MSYPALFSCPPVLDNVKNKDTAWGNPEQAPNFALTLHQGSFYAGWCKLIPQVNTLEPLGPTVDELIELVYRVGRAADRGRFGGLPIMATSYEAPEPIPDADVRAALCVGRGALYRGFGN